MRQRYGYIDWLRGVAVLIMIEAHTLDAWTHPAGRESPWFGRAMILGGFGAPLFLFLAGVAVALSAGSKARKGSVAEASRAVQLRGWEIFALAFLFRLQAFLLGGGSSVRQLLKVDILNVMGLAIVVAAWLWGRVSTTLRARFLMFALLTAAVAMFTPLIRAAGWVGMLPEPIGWYLRPSPGWTNFTLFPSAAFLFGGAAVGVLADAWRDPASTARLQRWCVAAGAALIAIGYGTSYLPPIYATSNFWTSSPTFFFLRLGVLVLAMPVAWAWERWATRDRWSPVQQFGRTSLFIYWIHVEMVYGVLTKPIHRSLTLPQAIAAFALFTIAMFGVSLLKTRLGQLWHARAPEPVRDLSLRRLWTLR